MKFVIILMAFVITCCQSAGKPDVKIISSEHRKIKGSVPAERLLDSDFIVRETRFLASGTCEGRQPGSSGHEKAAQRILQDFRIAGTDSFSKSMEQTFTGKSIHGFTEGKNILALVKGKVHPDSFIVISAHYDHLGKNEDGTIYYGADDNASGVGCLVALAKYFAQNPPSYSLVFASFDREETGLEGAAYFVQHLPPGVTKQNIKLNLNMDMIARSDQNEIYVCGLRYYPAFGSAIHTVQSKTTTDLLAGHDSGPPHEDWTSQSDHYSFHKEHIPFLYIGVEDHPDYHLTSDTFDKIDLNKYIENCNMIAMLIRVISYNVGQSK